MSGLFFLWIESNWTKQRENKIVPQLFYSIDCSIEHIYVKKYDQKDHKHTVGIQCKKETFWHYNRSIFTPSQHTVRDGSNHAKIIRYGRRVPYVCPWAPIKRIVLKIELLGRRYNCTIYGWVESGYKLGDFVLLFHFSFWTPFLVVV